MGTCTSSSDIQVIPTMPTIPTINKKTDTSMIIIALTQILNTNHSTNKHLSLLLDNKLATLCLSDPPSNKTVPDKIAEYVIQQYDRTKNRKAEEINYNTNLIITSFIDYFKYFYNKHMCTIINICDIILIKDLIYFTANECSYYSKYLLSIFNTIEGLDDIIYLGSECYDTTGSNQYFKWSIIITTNKIIKTDLPDTYDSFKIVINILNGQ